MRFLILVALLLLVLQAAGCRLWQKKETPAPSIEEPSRAVEFVPPVIPTTPVEPLTPSVQPSEPSAPPPQTPVAPTPSKQPRYPEEERFAALARRLDYLEGRLSEWEATVDRIEAELAVTQGQVEERPSNVADDLARFRDTLRAMLPKEW